MGVFFYTRIGKARHRRIGGGPGLYGKGGSGSVDEMGDARPRSLRHQLLGRQGTGHEVLAGDEMLGVSVVGHGAHVVGFPGRVVGRPHEDAGVVVDPGGGVLLGVEPLVEGGGVGGDEGTSGHLLEVRRHQEGHGADVLVSLGSLRGSGRYQDQTQRQCGGQGDSQSPAQKAFPVPRTHAGLLSVLFPYEGACAPFTRNMV